jgi:hypothetical protein
MTYLRITLLVATLGLACLARADFINGSFETGDLTGWVETVGPGVLNPFGTTFGAGMDGTFWAWLGGFEEDVAIQQTLTGLNPGTTYAVDFIMASEFTADDNLRVSVNGGSAQIFTAPPYNPSGFNGGFWTVWVPKEYVFTATGTTARVQFDTLGFTAVGKQFDVGLDNVRLTQVSSVPEPGSIGLLLTAIVGLAGTKRLRRRSVA